MSDSVATFTRDGAVERKTARKRTATMAATRRVRRTLAYPKAQSARGARVESCESGCRSKGPLGLRCNIQ